MRRCTENKPPYTQFCTAPLLDIEKHPMVDTTHLKPNALGILAAMWGLCGFFYLIFNALNHLTRMSLAAFENPLTPLQWFLLIANVLFMAYSEGYKGFQKNYSPRFAARARYLVYNGNLTDQLLAPLFCMNFFNAPKHRIITSMVLLVMIVVLILVFRMLPQPWRGILDAGVVVGLSWGAIASLWFCFIAFTDKQYSADPEVTRVRS